MQFKNILGPDMYHPVEAGHKMIADTLVYLFEKTLHEKPIFPPEALATYEPNKRPAMYGTCALSEMNKGGVEVVSLLCKLLTPYPMLLWTSFQL